MGIDPGNVRAGYGFIKKSPGGLYHIGSGILNIRRSGNAGAELYSLEKDLLRLVDKYKPGVAGLEKLFVSKNLKTVMGVAEARGIIHKVIFQKKIRLAELAPQTVKLAVTGSGRADKKAVAKMVGLLLKINTSALLDDVTDALAIAIAASAGFDI